MDSRLIAGAYSTAATFHTIELEQLSESNRYDSLARARKLSQDTNKRRRFQAQKRKLEAKREERRRQEILTKRREEQKLATEKYQRSHIPPSARQVSGRQSPRRQGPALDDALRLIRGNQHVDRPKSGRDGMHSPRDENHDPMERSYFDHVWHHPVLSPPSRSTHPKDPGARAELMDSSLQNLTSSKTLFEQQLEQQQHLLLEKQQIALKEFDRAIRKEIDKDLMTHGIIDDINSKTLATDDDNSKTLATDDDNDSCSSLDSLEEFKEGMTEFKGKNNMTAQTEDGLSEEDQSGSTEFHFQPEQMFISAEEAYRKNSDFNNFLVNDAMMKRNDVNTPGHLTTSNFANHSMPQNELSYVGVTRNNILRDRNINKGEYVADLTSNGPPVPQPSPLKQFSTDSLESVSTVNSPPQSSAGGATYMMSPRDESPQTKLNAGYKLQQQNRIENNLVWVSPHADDSTKQPAVAPGGGSFQPRYSSLIGSSLLPGPSPQNQPSYFLTSTNQFSNNRGNPSQNAPIKMAPTVNMALNSTLQNNPVLIYGNTADTKPMSSRPSFNNSSHINQLIPLGKQGAQYSQATDQQKSHPHPSLQNQIQISTIKMQPADELMKNFSIKSDVVNTQNAHTYNATNTTSWIQGTSSHQLIDQNKLAQPQHGGLPSQDNIPVPAPTLRSNNLSYLKNDLLTKRLAENSPLGVRLNSEGQGSVMENKSEVNSDPRIGDRVGRGEERESDEPVEVRPVRGILKASPLNHELEAGEDRHLPERHHPRDSLEIARLQTQKKTNKKSVRFADHRLEETEYDSNGTDMMMNSRGYLNKTMPTRPFSAKVFSGALRADNVVKVQRAASAGAVRPAPDDSSAQIQIRNVQQMYAGPPPFNPYDNTNTNSYNPRSNLPPSFTTPLNTTLPVNNRPRAAAHIIMSSEVHPPVKSNENDNSPAQPSAAPAGSTAHKSQLEMKVKAINNNFMTKVPVKIPNPTNVTVYHAVYSRKELDQNSNKSNQGNQSPAEGNSQTLQKEEQQQQSYERSRIRDTTARRVAISNQTVTRTSVVPTSTKISYPQSNYPGPSYSNAANNTPPQVYDENGLRIDRTPTDEEITWLWDKVRNCLQREDNKSQTTGPSAESMPRPQTYLSTKLIDGASLGFGTTPGMRSGSGFFHPQSSPSVNTQNKAKPVPLQQGSYLKRFGLLKQRRTNSATAVGNAAINSNPRSNSAVYNRHQTVFPPHPTASNGQPQQQHDGPVSIAFAYKPQDEVSESTAAFLMAERLAKQSLTESHIQMAMEDAQNKQEAHNRSKMMAARGGHSALSIEEQRLMESLDKLNERLKAVEPGRTNGTIHYHQAYQTQLTGFQSQTATNDSRRLTATSPRTQQRSQSARIRQQTRQYR